MRNLLVVILILSIVQSGLGCGKKKGKGLKKLGEPLQPAAPPPPPDKLGPVAAGPYTPAGDDAGDCESLKCNVDDPCKWTNALPPADQLSFVKGSGDPDPTLLQQNFGTSQKPEGSFFLVKSERAGTSEQSAQLYSAPISCSNGEITVNLKNWQTKGTHIEVCEEKSPEGPPENCQPVPAESGQQHSVKIPKADEPKRIVIQAKGFTDPTGDVAMVDDIEVQCEPCASPPPTEETTTPGAVTPGGVAPCKEIQCDFESGNPCSYSPASSGGNAAENWQTKQVPYQNALTGIRKDSPNPKKFGAAYTKKKDEKTTLSTDANFDKDYVVKYKLYKSVEGVTIKGCCDDESNCPQQIKKEADVADYKTWREAALTCKQGTKKVLFVCHNEDGKSEGACGIDDIRLYQATSGDPNDASESACPGGGGGRAKAKAKKSRRV